MTDSEKKQLLQQLDIAHDFYDGVYYKALEDMGDLKTDYYTYSITQPMNCDDELKRLPHADYELCTALLTMLLREDHFSNGSFMRRGRSGQVQPIIDRMIELLGMDVTLS